MTDLEFQTAAFFCGNSQALELWELLKQAISVRCPSAQYKVQKTQISFFDRYGFAFISLPRGKKPGILVSFGLPARLDSPRIFQAVEPYPDRWTHHILLSSPAEIDGELLGWIETAWQFSLTKQRKR